MSADDLVVLEDGVEQKIDTFQEATTPVSLVLALDASGSMKKSADKVVEAARAFVATVRPEDKLAVVVFADQSVVAHDLTLDRKAVSETVDGYDAIGGTALYDALCDSFSLVKQAPGRRAVVVLTDGRDENNPGTAPGSTRTLRGRDEGAPGERGDRLHGRPRNEDRPRAAEGAGERCRAGRRTSHRTSRS